MDEATDSKQISRGTLIVVLVGVAVLAVVVALGRWRSGSELTPALADAAAPAEAAAQLAPRSAPAPAAATPAAPVVSTSAAAAAELRTKMQERLDALAKAYEQGDARAAERAMWPNHAVVRADGEKFGRRELLANWAEEWAAIQNRNLKFYVEDIIEDGARVTAVWTILLTGDLANADGDGGHMMINGKQQATLTRDLESLDGPIEYTAFERTLNGFAWPLE